MAGHGPPPKDPATRRRRNAKPEGKKIASDGRMRGPQLPKDLPWHPRTSTWWNTWRRSAQAKTFTPTDWEFLLETAMLHTLFWSGRTDVANELRLRVAKFGATPEDRQRLHMDLDKPPAPAASAQAKPDGVTDIASRRKRLTG